MGLWYSFSPQSQSCFDLTWRRPNASFSIVIGVFDSGIGGLGVLRRIREQLPDADLVYVADRARSPYGIRPEHQIVQYSDQITQHLISKGAQMIVVACNTASSAALHELRHRYPDVPFTGMEPAVKPAALLSETGVIGVLVTPSTGSGGALASVVDRFARDVSVRVETCPDWVSLVEEGEFNGPRAEEAVKRHIEPLVKSGADVLVLGCTHYPFLSNLIQEAAGSSVILIDPAESVARQVSRVASQVGAVEGKGSTRIEVNGRFDDIPSLLSDFLDLDADIQAVVFTDE